MSKLVPNKKTYVKRLKAMLERKEPCERCPCGFRSGFSRGILDNDCKMCQEFVSLRYFSTWEHSKTCPCSRFGKQRAITRALQAIEAYEAGTHKWCKENP